MGRTRQATRRIALAGAATCAALSPMVATADEYIFNACGFNSQGWHKSPQAAADAAADAATRFSLSFAKPCPPGTYWSSFELRARPAGNGKDYGFDFRMTVHSIGYEFGPGYQRCVKLPDQVGQWQQCGLMIRRSTVDRYLSSPAPAACDADRGVPSFGNPILPTVGSKRMSIRLAELGGLPVELVYDTTRKVATTGDNPTNFVGGPAPLSELWRISVHRGLQFGRSTDGVLRAVNVWRGSGDVRSFTFTPSGYAVPSTATSDRLWVVDSELRDWYFYDSSAGITEHYYDGKLIAYQADRSADAVQLVHDASGLRELRDSRGRTIRLNQSQVGNQGYRLSQIELPSGVLVDLVYDSAGRLQSIVWPDQSAQTFLYEDPLLPWAMTGVVDEVGQRVSKYRYDPSGHVLSTERAGQSGQFGQDRFEVQYGAAPTWKVTERHDDAYNIIWRDHVMQAPSVTRVIGPSGASDIQVESINGLIRLTSQSQPAGSGCAASTARQTFDSRGHLTSRDDFNGTRSCYSRDALGRETVRVEGLAGGSSGTNCADVLRDGATLPGEASKTTTVWHPYWRLPVQEALPGRTITYRYHAQPDPLDPNGRRPQCAPAGVGRIDGGVVPLLCSRVEQATQDANGSVALLATVDVAVPPRVSAWTYNQRGQVLTRSEPATGTTRLDYHEATSATATIGDVLAVTNALGHVTRYPEYTRSGQPLLVVDPNGVATRYAYDVRDRLTSGTANGRTTSYAYYPHGALQRLTQPDGSFLEFVYDAGQRLVMVTDHLGHSIRYTLDAAGRRTVESVVDAQGTLRRELQRSYDALGRVQASIGRDLP